MNKRIAAALILVIAIVLAAIFFLSNSSREGERYAYIPSALVDAPSFVAAPQLADVGVVPVPFVTGRDTAQSLIGDAAVAATLAEWPILLATESRADLRVVAIITQADSLGILVNTGANINSTDDLRGKKVGFPQGTSAQFLFEDFTNAEGVLAQVEAVNLPPQQLQASMESGDIDAMVIWQPFLERARLSNLDAFKYLDGSQTHFQVIYCVVSTEANIREHPEEISKILKALIDAESKLNAGDEETLLALSSQTGLDIPTLKRLLPLFQYRVVLDDSLLQSWQRLAPWAAEKGLIAPESVNQEWEKYFHSDLLRAIDPSRVEIQ